MTLAFRREDASISPTYGNVYPQESGLVTPRRWTALVKQLRTRLGLSQSTLADHLGVTQASVSRWESGRDLPSIRMRRTMREMLRTSNASRVTQQLKARLRYTPFPMSIVGLGARFLDFSRSFAAETATEPGRFRGHTIYGHFGDSVDATTEMWERSGIFNGEIAMTLTVLTIVDPSGNSIFLKNFDTPHILEDERIITICETQRILIDEYNDHIYKYGNPVFLLSYDEIV